MVTAGGIFGNTFGNRELLGKIRSYPVFLWAVTNVTKIGTERTGREERGKDGISKEQIFKNNKITGNI